MRYLLMIAGDESQFATATAEQGAAMTAEYADYTKAMADRGVLQGGERLRPTTDATTVRVRNGETLSTDGPFAETKEQLAGYLPRRLQGPGRGDRGRGPDPGRPHRQHRSEADLGDCDPRCRAPRSPRPSTTSGAGWSPRSSGSPVTGTSPRSVRRMPSHGRWSAGPTTASRAAPARGSRRWPGTARSTGCAGASWARRSSGRSPMSTGTDDVAERGRRARRPAAPDVHLLSPGPRVRRAGRAHACGPSPA